MSFRRDVVGDAVRTSLGVALRPLSRLYCVELIVLAFAVLAVLLYALLGIPLRVPAYLYVRKVGFALLTYLFGLILMLCLQRLADIQTARRTKQWHTWSETLLAYRNRFLHPAVVCRSVRCMHAIGCMFVVYINLKHLIPFVNERIYDGAFLEFETALFFGYSPTRLCIELFGTSSAALLSQGYTLFYPYIAFYSVAIVLRPEAVIVQKRMASFALLWCSAILIVYAFPTLGPCFSTPEIIADLPFTRVTELQQELLRQRTYVLANPTSPWGVFLISGLPSLHVALVLQGSLFFQSYNRVLALFSWVLLSLTLVSTVYFAWHFVSDLLAAVVLVFAVERVVDLLFRLKESRRFEMQSSAVPQCSG